MLEFNSIESKKYVSISRDQVITKMISTAKEKPGIQKAGYNNIMGLMVLYSGMFNNFSTNNIVARVRGRISTI